LAEDNQLESLGSRRGVGALSWVDVLIWGAVSVALMGCFFVLSRWLWQVLGS
jgi:hypothetical protein